MKKPTYLYVKRIQSGCMNFNREIGILNEDEFLIGRGSLRTTVGLLHSSFLTHGCLTMCWDDGGRLEMRRVVGKVNEVSDRLEGEQESDWSNEGRQRRGSLLERGQRVTGSNTNHAFPLLSSSRVCSTCCVCLSSLFRRGVRTYTAIFSCWVRESSSSLFLVLSVQVSFTSHSQLMSMSSPRHSRASSSFCWSANLTVSFRRPANVSLFFWHLDIF